MRHTRIRSGTATIGARIILIFPPYPRPPVRQKCSLGWLPENLLEDHQIARQYRRKLQLSIQIHTLTQARHMPESVSRQALGGTLLRRILELLREQREAARRLRGGCEEAARSGP